MMKLSAAIRFGAKKKQQCYCRPFGIWTVKETMGDGSSALGAAIEGAKLVEVAPPIPDKADGVLRNKAIDQWPELTKFHDCPGRHKRRCHYKHMRASLILLIEHLNDDHRWTREQIADWLESEGY